MGVLTGLQEKVTAEIGAAALAVQAGKVRDTLGRWAPPKVKHPQTGETSPGMRGASVLVVAFSDDEARELAAALRDVPATFDHVATHGPLTGRGFDVIVYRPGWRGTKTKAHDPHPAADQWRTAIVRTRQVRPGVELYL